MRSATFWRVLSFGLTLGFILRYLLAFVVFSNQGFAWDLATFGSWIDTIRANGFNSYQVGTGMNYPPVFASWLGALIWAGDTFGFPAIELIKWPAILADLGIATTLAVVGRRWFSPRIGLFAALAYLFMPVTWYDSAIWGQVDSLAALPMLLAVVFLIEKRPEVAFVFFTIAVLTKPQGVLLIFILAPVLVGQIIQKQLLWPRLLTTTGAGVVAFFLLAGPWNLESYAAEGVARVPILGDLVGLAGQYFATAGLFPVLTANALNIWATVGNIPMTNQLQGGRVYWLPDSFNLFGMPAGLLGTGLFVMVALYISWSLVKKHSSLQVLVATSFLLVAFFALPTRVHERYLVQAFAFLALTCAATAWQRGWLVLLSIANTINLHVILVGDLKVETIAVPPQSQPFGPPWLFSNDKFFASTMPPPEFYGVSWPALEAGWARAPGLIWAVVIAHSIALVLVGYQYFQVNRVQR